MSNAQFRSRIAGTGSYAPDRVVTNAEMEKLVETSDEWIVERTGIKQRRYAAEGENTSDMALHASRRALQAAGIEPAELDMIIVGTISGDTRLPACAAYLQKKLGCAPVPAFDVSAACAGFVYAMSVADQFVRTGACKNVLVVGVELLSRLTNFTDRNTCVLFGDGAGAVIVQQTDASSTAGILSTKLFTDSELTESLLIPAGGTREPITAESIEQHRDKIFMQGQDIFKIAVRKLYGASQEALDAAGMSSSDIDWVVPHQANLRIIAQVAQRLHVPLDRFILNIENYGNTSSASIPLALDEAVRDGRIKPGQTVLMCALGAGISWASALIRL
jgi:3-oxoacyl-[acyl-carrier-protein] synthase-3